MKLLLFFTSIFWSISFAAVTSSCVNEIGSLNRGMTSWYSAKYNIKRMVRLEDRHGLWSLVRASYHDAEYQLYNCELIKCTEQIFQMESKFNSTQYMADDFVDFTNQLLRVCDEIFADCSYCMGTYLAFDECHPPKLC